MMVAPPPLQQRLEAAAAALKPQRIEALFDNEPDRTAHYRCSAQGLILDLASTSWIATHGRPYSNWPAHGTCPRHLRP